MRQITITVEERKTADGDTALEICCKTTAEQNITPLEQHCTNFLAIQHDKATASFQRLIDHPLASLVLKAVQGMNREQATGFYSLITSILDPEVKAPNPLSSLMPKPVPTDPPAASGGTPT